MCSCRVHQSLLALAVSLSVPLTPRPPPLARSHLTRSEDKDLILRYLFPFCGYVHFCKKKKCNFIYYYFNLNNKVGKMVSRKVK